jgi:hypothetical protein
MRLSAVLLVNVLDVPVMDTAAVPVGELALAVRVSVLVAAEAVATVGGTNDAVTPLGRPEADKVTLPEKPLTGFNVIVLVPRLPCTTPTAFGEDESEKEGDGGVD